MEPHKERKNYPSWTILPEEWGVDLPKFREFTYVVADRIQSIVAKMEGKIEPLCKKLSDWANKKNQE